MTWDDEDIIGPENERPTDAYEESARDVLKQFFEDNKRSVFFGNQLAIRHEDDFFHWVTYRAMSELVLEGTVLSERRKLAIGSEVRLFWHHSHRYYKRDAKTVVDLVNEYSSPNICGAVGLHGEQMMLEGFASKQFVMIGRDTRTYRNNSWTESEHELDFIFERDNQAYGVEVKNMLSYMDEEELTQKIRMCKHLGIAPVIAARMLPKSWIRGIANAGGFALVLKYQLYPWSHRDLAKKVRQTLGIPVDAPRRLADQTMARFVQWHEKRVNREQNSQ